MRRPPSPVLLLAALLITLLHGSPALAHVDLRMSVPIGDSTVEDPPVEIVLTFTGDLEADADPAVRVTDPAGDDLVSAPAVANGDTVTVPLNQAVVAGVHTVDWAIVAPDGDPITGSFSFTYAPADVPAAATTTPAPTMTDTSTAGAAPSEADTPIETPDADPVAGEPVAGDPVAGDVADLTANLPGGPLIAIGVVAAAAAMLILRISRRDDLDPDKD